MASDLIAKALPANTVQAAVATAQIFALTANPLFAATLPIRGKGILDLKRFTVLAQGNATTAGAYTVKASLYGALVAPASPLVAANWSLLGTGTARAVATTTAPWQIRTTLQFDSVGGTLQGTFDQLINNLFDATAAITNALTGINGTNITQTQGGSAVLPADPAFVMAVGLTFGTANAGNIGILNQFELDF